MSFKVDRLTILHNGKSLVDISFEINSSFALIGESGSGKSLTLKALLNLLPKELEVILKIRSDFELIKGKSISFVPQNPFTALSPLTKIKDQFHVELNRAKEYLDMVELDGTLLFRYPSELSGGQLQRVIIAMALSLNPKLILLDEPTTALDSNTKTSIIELIKNLQSKIGFLSLFVTHDIDVAKDVSKEVAILKDGKIVESGDILKVLQYPKTSYAQKLIDSNFKNREFRL